MVAEEIKYKLYGLPKDWANSEYQNTGLSPTEIPRLQAAFSTIRKGVCYIQGDAGPVANQYIKAGYKVRGINAETYILDPFDKEEKGSLPDAGVVFIYNCIETTTSIGLTQKVLKKLVQNYPNSMVIMVGELTGRSFAKELYPAFNFCSIPFKKEEKWL